MHFHRTGQFGQFTYFYLLNLLKRKKKRRDLKLPGGTKRPGRHRAV